MKTRPERKWKRDWEEEKKEEVKDAGVLNSV